MARPIPRLAPVCDTCRARRSRGLVDHGLRLVLRVLLLGDRFADLEPDALELLDHVGDLALGQVVLDRKRLELGRLDPAALLTCGDQRLGTLGLEQFGKLALSQVGIDVLSFLRTLVLTCREGQGTALFNARGCAAIPARPH